MNIFTSISVFLLWLFWKGLLLEVFLMFTGVQMLQHIWHYTSAHTKLCFSRKLFNCGNQGCRNCGWWKDSNVTLGSEILSGLPHSSTLLLCVRALLWAERKRYSQIFYHQMLMVKCKFLFKTAEGYMGLSCKTPDS